MPRIVYIWPLEGQVKENETKTHELCLEKFIEPPGGQDLI
jgi:hypothetical protein